MGHMMYSVMLGVVFAVLIAPRLRGRNAMLIAGVVFGIAHVMWGAVLGAALAWQTQGFAGLRRAPA